MYAALAYGMHSLTNNPMPSVDGFQVYASAVLFTLEPDLHVWEYNDRVKKSPYGNSMRVTEQN